MSSQQVLAFPIWKDETWIPGIPMHTTLWPSPDLKTRCFYCTELQIAYFEWMQEWYLKVKELSDHLFHSSFQEVRQVINKENWCALKKRKWYFISFYFIYSYSKYVKILVSVLQPNLQRSLEYKWASQILLERNLLLICNTLSP